MASILDILNTTSGEQLVKKASTTTSEKKETIITAFGLIFPILLGIMKKKTETEEGSEEIFDLLKKEKYGQEYLNGLSGKEAAEISSQGDRLIKNMLGSNSEIVKELLTNCLGIKESTVEELLKFAAPLIVNVLAAQRDKEDLRAKDMKELLQSALGSSSAHDSSLIETLMSKKPDARVINEIEGMIFGGNNKGKRRWDSKLRGMTGGK